MKIKLLKDARITHKAGEIVEVSPDEGAFLVAVMSAVLCTGEEEPQRVKKKATAKK